MLQGRYCAYCGKNFFPHKYWAYKQCFHGYNKWFCKRSCMLRYREEYQKKMSTKTKEESNGLD